MTVARSQRLLGVHRRPGQRGGQRERARAAARPRPACRRQPMPLRARSCGAGRRWRTAPRTPAGAAAATRRRRPAASTGSSREQPPAASRKRIIAARPPGPRVPLRGHEPDDVEQPVRVGTQPQVGRAGPADRGGDRGPLLAAAASAYRSRSSRSAVWISCSVAGLRVDERRARPTSGSSSSRGSRISMASTSWRTASLRSGRAHVAGRRGSRRSPRPARAGAAAGRSASTRAPRSPRGPGRERGVGRPLRSSALGVSLRPGRAGQPAQLRRRCRSPRRSGCRRARSGGPSRPPRRSARSRFSQRAVPKSRLADRSTASQVSSSRSAIGLPYVRDRGAGGDRPVHPAHVVARPVLAGLPGLAARPGQQAEVVALQQPVEPAGDEHRSWASAVSARSAVVAARRARPAGRLRARPARSRAARPRRVRRAAAAGGPIGAAADCTARRPAGRAGAARLAPVGRRARRSAAGATVRQRHGLQHPVARCGRPGCRRRARRS